MNIINVPLFLALLLSTILSSTGCDSIQISMKFTNIDPDLSPRYKGPSEINDDHRNVLINNQLPIIMNLTLESQPQTFNLLIDTGSLTSWIVSQSSTQCNWALSRYSTSKNVTFTVNKTSTFMVKNCDALVDKQNDIIVDNKGQRINFAFYEVVLCPRMDTFTFFDGILGIGRIYPNEDLYRNRSAVRNFFPLPPVDLFAVLSFKRSENKLYIGSLPDELKNDTTICSTDTNLPPEYQNYWNCKLDFILFGDELDFYLAKKIESTAIFDSLSYYNIIPIEYIEYFLNNFLTRRNRCTAKPLGGYNLARIECESLSGLTQFKSISFFFNGWAYRINPVDLFEQKDSLLPYQQSRKGTYFLKILFSSTETVWRLGTGFFNKVTVGYNFSKDKVILYSKDKFDFTDYTLGNQVVENDVMFSIIMVEGVALVLILIILLAIFLTKMNTIERNLQRREIVDNKEN